MWIPTETAFVNPDNVDPVSACGLNMTQEVGCDDKYFLDPDVLERWDILKIWETSISTWRIKCEMIRFLQGTKAGGLVRIILTEADSPHILRNNLCTHWCRSNLSCACVRIPYCFLLLGGIVTALSLLGLCLVSVCEKVNTSLQVSVLRLQV